MKKGFTLAELLGVIVILAVVALIAFPIVSQSIDSNRKKLYQSQLDEIKLGAEKWAYENINMLPTANNGTVTITLLNLKESGFLPLDIKNPITGKLLPNDMTITITYRNNSYDITVNGESGTDVNNDFNSNAPTIILNGEAITYVEIKGTYSELGAIAKDKDGNLIDDISITYREGSTEVGGIDASRFTTYSVVYSATSNGYTSNITRTVIVRDTTAPVLSLEDTTELTKDELASFNLLAGVSVTDNSGETINIQTSGFDRLPTDKIVEYKACDSSNNCTTKRRIIKIVSVKEYVDNSGANKPKLLANMIPIKYNGSSWVYADVSEEWYDYNSKEWANAVVLNSGVTKSVGNTISESEIALWYVWIPRYKYQLFNANNGSVSVQQINVTFETGTSTTGTVRCVDKVSKSGNDSEICTNAINGNWYTHPAFTFGDKDLTGFWMGKFEVSTTNSTCNSTPSATNCNKELPITIKPGVSSFRYASIANQFNSIRNIETDYGISNGDSHMTKNMEWGAVAYLKQSKYGLGIADIGFNSSNSSYYTGGGSGTSYKINVTYSTTGNIYGVYDMSGGSWEYVMGNMVDSSGNFYASRSGFTSAPEDKYYDKYTYGTSLAHARGKLGDATKETLTTFGSSTGGWYSDYAYFVSASDSWFPRSGSYSDGSSAGVFYFNGSRGSAYGSVSSRAVITPN